MRDAMALTLAIALMASCALMGCAQEVGQDLQESLAPNPGFEEGRGDAPADWKYYSWRDSRGWWDNRYAHSGRRSLGFEGPNGGWSTTLKVQPGLIYNLSFYYRAEVVPCRFVLSLRIPGGDMPSLLYKPMPAVPHTQSGEFVDGVFVGGADERGWVLAEVGDFVPPEGVTELNLLIKLTSEQADARAWLDDVLLTAAEPREVPDTARLLRRVPGAVVWTDSENRKILHDQVPPQGEELAAVEIAAAGGEYESFQIAVTPDREMAAVAWNWEPFSGPAQMPADALRCRRVEYVDIRKTEGPFGYQGLNPDALTDRLPCDIARGFSQPFWFTVRVPAGQKAGAYDTTLTLLGRGGEVCQVPLRLTVRGFDIPRTPSLDTRSTARWTLVLDREQGDPDEILQRYYRDVYEHRTRCSPRNSIAVRVEGAKVQVEMDGYVEELRFLRDECGAERVDIPALWIGHGGTHRMPPDVRWQRLPIFANAALTTLNPEFVAVFGDYMTQLVERLKHEGLFLQPTVRFIDEPNMAHNETINGIRALSELFKQIEPELQIANTCSYPHPDLLDVTDVWVLHTDSWDRSLAHIARAREVGDRINVYNNAVNYPDHRPIRIRLWPWLLKKYRVDGTYSWWGTVCWRNDVEDPWTAGRGSSGVLLYPPRDASEHGPIDSVRWELYREGLEDYEYMVLAETLAEQLEAAGKAKLAKQGRDALAEALALVERWPNVRAANDEPYTLDVTRVKAAREALAAAIEAMQAAR